MTPSDLVPLAEAARVAERSERSIRRWMSAGKLTRHEGPPPGHGGAAPVLVSTSELMGVLAVSGQKARVEPELDTPGHHPDIVSGNTPGMTDTRVDTPSDTAILVAELRGQLEVAELRAELAKITAERDALQGQVVTMAKRHAAEMNRGETETAHLRADVKDWRERHDAREAELRAVRGLTGRSWWQRLLPGPTASPAWEEA